MKIVLYFLLLEVLFLVSLILGTPLIIGGILLNTLSLLFIILKIKGRKVWAFIASTIIFNLSITLYQMMASLFLPNLLLASLAFFGYLLLSFISFYFLLFVFMKEIKGIKADGK